jgi:hypothetical protein
MADARMNALPENQRRNSVALRRLFDPVTTMACRRTDREAGVADRVDVGAVLGVTDRTARRDRDKARLLSVAALKR